MIERVRHRKELHKQRGRAYRIAFGIAGFVVLLGGIFLSLPFVPGPGLLFVAIGLGMLALEFAWAERVLERTLERMSRTSRAVRHGGRLRQALSAAASIAGLAAVLFAALYFDIPFLPF
jgi:uncharacterized protein (TIGR02611 family)